MEEFDEIEDMKFSWTGFFGVTGVCCFVFSLFLKFSEDENTPLLLICGTVLLIIAFFSFVIKKQKDTHKKLRKRSAIFNED